MESLAIQFRNSSVDASGLQAQGVPRKIIGKFLPKKRDSDIQQHKVDEALSKGKNVISDKDPQEGTRSKIPVDDSKSMPLQDMLDDDMTLVEEIPIERVPVYKFLPPDTVHVLEQIGGNDKDLESHINFGIVPCDLGMPQFVNLDSVSSSQISESFQDSSTKVPDSFQSSNEGKASEDVEHVSNSPKSAPQLFNDKGK